MDEHGPWAPLSVAGMRSVMAGFPAPWWIAGGWAVDLSLGRQTRPHGDIDTPRDAADFEVAKAALDAPARVWLTSALEATQATHPWIARLSEDR